MVQQRKMLEELKHTLPEHSCRRLNQVDAFGWSALHYACFHGKLGMCRALVEAGADVNLRAARGYESPLFLAAAASQAEVVSYLLEQKADPNITDITGLIPLEVSSGRTHEILSLELHAQHKLVRLLPTVRKLAASKFTQILLQLLLCVFLELCQDKLIASMQMAIQLIVMFRPHHQFISLIVGVFDRMIGPLLFPVLQYFGPFITSIWVPLVQTLLLFWRPIAQMGSSLLMPLSLAMHYLLYPVMQSFSTLFRGLVMPSIRLLGSTVWILLSPFVAVFTTILQSIVLPTFHRLFTPLFWLARNAVAVVWTALAAIFYPLWSAFLQTSLVQSSIRFVTLVMQKTVGVILRSLEPRQLAARLVSPIILCFSKLLYLLPTSWVDAMVRAYMRIAGRSRHISDEEVAAVSLLCAGVGVYFFSILGGGYILRTCIYLLYRYDLYVAVLERLCDVSRVFDHHQYATLVLKPDGPLHELGLIFTIVVLPISIVGRIVIYCTSALYTYSSSRFTASVDHKRPRSPQSPKRSPGSVAVAPARSPHHKVTDAVHRIVAEDGIAPVEPEDVNPLRKRKAKRRKKKHSSPSKPLTTQTS